MVPFLKQVAAAYYDRGLVESSCFIFPNRRSEVFFMKYLSDILAARTRAGENTVPLAVPAGVASTALYYTVNKVIRHSRGYIWKEFWQAFRSNFKQTGIVTLIVAAVAFVIAIDGYIMLQFAQAGRQGGVLYIVFFVMLIFEAAWAIYLFPYMARFENTTKQVLKNTALMAIGNLPKTLLMLLILALVCLGTYIIPLFIFFIPAVYTLVINFIMEKIFMRYMSEEDIAAEQERNREFYQ